MGGREGGKGRTARRGPPLVTVRPVGPAYSMWTGVRDWNQLRAWTKPLTCCVIARGATSWTTQTKRALSTSRVCTFASQPLRSSG